MSKKNNVTAKAFALLIAIFLWSYVMSEVNPEIVKEIRNVEVHFYNTSALKREGLVLMEPSEYKVNVKVRGKKSHIDKFSGKNIIVQADLTGYDEGKYKVPLTYTLVGDSSNISVVSIDPNEILFSFDKIISKSIAIAVETEGEVAEGYLADSTLVKPQTVLITGPRTWVNQVDKAQVTLNLEGRSTSANLTMPIQLLDDQGQLVMDLDKDPMVAEVSVEILRKKLLEIKLQTLGELPDNYELDDLKLSPASLYFKGDSSLEQLEYINTKPIDLKTLIDGSFTGVELDLPENISLLNEDEVIKLNYTLEEISDREFEINLTKLDFRNLGRGLLIEEKEDGNIKLTLRGLKKELGKLKVDDIVIYVDLADLESGSHSLDIKMDPLNGFKLQSQSKDKINITLKGRAEDKEEEDQTNEE